MNSVLIQLIDRVRMLDNDLIRLTFQTKYCNNNQRTIKKRKEIVYILTQ